MPTQRHQGPARAAVEESARVVLAAHPDAVRYARLFVLRCCEGARFDPEACDAAVLLTSEVVTNALVTGHGEPALTVRARPGWVRVEVAGSGPGQPSAGGGAGLAGRGLAILDRLASAWGSDDGRVVWFEVTSDDRPSDAAAAPEPA